jgi:transcriptional regulator with XRE-family HTH domain
MKDRILVFLQNENKSYAQFAEEIGVQPSGISHILSGRNNPSLDFVIKMLHKYSSLSADWLLFGRGPMHKYVSQPTLFDIEASAGSPEPPEETRPSEIFADALNASGVPEPASEEEIISGKELLNPQRKISRVLFFYSDKTFTEYKPS